MNVAGVKVFFSSLYNQFQGSKFLEDLQKRKLERIISYARNFSPFYRDRYPSRFSSIRELPIVDKNLFQKYRSDFISEQINTGRCVTRSTSGSSGKMVSVLWDEKNLLSRLVYMYRAWSFLGYHPLKKAAYFLPVGEDIGFNFGLFPHRHFSPGEDPKKVVRELLSFRPFILSTYPSYAAELVGTFGQDILREIGIKVVSLNSEMTSPCERKYVEVGFGCQTFEEYSCVEAGVIAAMCREGNRHIFTDNVYLELLDEHDEPTDGIGEVVVTALNSFAMPFIRYRLGDYAKLIAGECPCGLGFPMISSVEGRRDDSFLLKSGERIPAWQLYEIIERPLEKDGHVKDVFRDIYLVQRSSDVAEFYFSKGSDFSSNYVDEIKRKAKARFQGQLHFEAIPTESIERVKQVKRKYIHCEL